MLRLPQFKYLSPQSANEASSFLKEHNGKAKLLGGGTDLIPSMKDRLLKPEFILDLSNIPGMRNVKKIADRDVQIGSRCSMSEIEASPVLQELFPALVDAASLVATPAIRNMGTLGGNIALDTRCMYFNQSRAWRKSIEKCLKLGGDICHVVKGAKRCYACFTADTVPALIALNAQIIIMGKDGEKQCLLEEIYTQDGKAPNTLEPEDFITEICLPMPDKASGSSYKKLMLREAIDFPLAGSAVNIVMDGNTCRDVKIVLGAIESGPVEVSEAKTFLKGKTLTDEIINKAGAIALDAAHPVANRGSTPTYRKKMVGVFTQRALREAINRAAKKEEK